MAGVVDELLSIEISAQDVNKGRGDGLLLDAWSNADTVLICVRIGTSRTWERRHLLVDRVVAWVADLSYAYAFAFLIVGNSVLAIRPGVTGQLHVGL